jgi:sulfoacetaldehyde acetyltransferase
VRLVGLYGLEGGDARDSKGRCGAGARYAPWPIRHVAAIRIDYWPKDAKIIQVDADPRMLGLVKPISVAVNGDAAEAAEEITKRLSSGNMKIAAHGTREQRLEEVRKQKKDWENELTKLSSGEGSPISPRRALRELEKAMPRTPW